MAPPGGHDGGNGYGRGQPGMFPPPPASWGSAPPVPQAPQQASDPRGYPSGNYPAVQAPQGGYASGSYQQAQLQQASQAYSNGPPSVGPASQNLGISSDYTPAHTPAPAGAAMVGRYELLLELASGGMGSVYVGRQRGAAGFERLVAIKRMHPHLASEEEFWLAFQQEAKIASLIHHANVVNVIDVYEDGGERLLVMEYVDGVAASSLLAQVRKQKSKLPRGVAVRIAVDALHGLHAAHELVNLDGMPLQVVHRDVSPQNILVGIDGSIRLTDFGIARAVERLVHTATSQLKGKLRYMAPEQAHGRNVDRRADIFALGIVLWEMLVGRRLYTGETDVEVLQAAALAHIPSPREFDPSISPELERVLLTALAKEPEHRFATALQFAQALEQYAWETRELAPHQDVAQSVQALVGDRLLGRKKQIQEALSGRRTIQRSLPQVSVLTPATGTNAFVTGPVSGSTQKTGRSAMTIMAAVALATAVGGGAAAFLFLRRGPEASQQPAPVATSSTDAADAKPIDRVKVELTSSTSIREVRGPGIANVKFSNDGAAFELPKGDLETHLVVIFQDGTESALDVVPKDNIALHIGAPVASTTASAEAVPALPLGRRPGPLPTATSGGNTGLRKNPYGTPR